MSDHMLPFLMFEGRAEEAMTLYVSLFPDARIEKVERYGAAGPGKEGSVMARSNKAFLGEKASTSRAQFLAVPTPRKPRPGRHFRRVVAS